MPSKLNPIFALLLLTVLAALSAQAAFLNNDTTGMTVLVNFDQFNTFGDWGTPIDGSIVEVYNQSGLTVNMGIPNFDSEAEDIRYGRTNIGSMIVDPHIGNSSTLYDRNAGRLQTLEFAFAGGAVASIGIRMSTIPGQPLTNVILEVFGSGSTTIPLETYTLSQADTPAAFNALSNGGGNPDLGVVYGVTRTNADIVSFRITGGVLVMDDLYVGGLQLAGAGGGDTDTGAGDEGSAVPEPATYVFCAAALAMMAWGLRRRQQAGGTLAV